MEWTRRRAFGAGDGDRTRDLELGKLRLYQLSYARSLEVAGFYNGTVEGSIPWTIGSTQSALYSPWRAHNPQPSHSGRGRCA